MRLLEVGGYLANRGGPLLNSWTIVNDASEINGLYTTPTPSEILLTFEHYILWDADGDPPEANNFIVSGGVLTSVANSNGMDFLLAPVDYPASYQYCKISSTSADDDSIGIIIGYKEDANYKYIMWVRIVLDNSPYPIIRAEVARFPLASSPGTVVIVPQFGYIGPVVPEVEYVGYAADASLGLNGWQQSPWPSGVHIRTTFNGSMLRVESSAPGGSASSTFIDFGANPLTGIGQGFSPRAGLVVHSQPGARWADYTLIDIGSVMNLDTQTIWAPDTNVPPTFVDSGVPVAGAVFPGRFAYSAVNDTTVYIDPQTKQAVPASYPF